MTGGAAPPPRWAEIIAVGTELLVPPRVDTNSLYITERLNECGIDVRIKTIVGDRREDLESAIRVALARTEVVILCGGLGPTGDDVTRDAVATVIGRPLEEDGAVVDSIRRRFAARGARMPEINRRQAMVPQGAVLLPNVLGTAPGLWLEHGGGVVILLPGPPGELKPMFDRVVADRLAPRAGDSRIYRRVLRICGRTESEVDEVTFPVYSRWLQDEPAVFTTVLTSPAQVELHLSTRMASPSAASARLDEATAELAAVLGPDLFSTDGRTLEETVGALLRGRGWRIAVAESCTGGLVSSRLTDVPGSSDYVTLNVVCYSNESKVSWLGVPQSALDSWGAVSGPVAQAMADGVRKRAGAALGIGVTGIAGPGGGTAAKPVGTVVIAVTTAESQMVRTFRFPVGRTRVRQFAAQMALDLARRVLMGAGAGGAFVFTGEAGGRA